MNKLKNSSAFKIVLLIVLNIFCYSRWLLILSAIYLIIELKLKIIIPLILFILCFISNFNKIDFIPLGIVEDTYDSYVVVDKILYKEKVYTSENIEVGSLVKVINSNINDDKSSLKYNYCFVSYENPNIIASKTLRSYVNKKINNIDSKYNNYLKKIILNDYDNDYELEFLGNGFTFYVLLLIIKRKNKYLSLLFLFIYTLLFKFDIKFYLIIASYISDLFKFNRIQSLSFKVFFIVLINKHLLFNKSIIISLLFSFIYLFDSKDKSLIMIVQSIFFNKITIGLTFFYSLYIDIRLSLFFISLLVLLFPFLGTLYLKYISLCSTIISIISFGIRGKINLFGILIFLIFKHIIKCKNLYIYYFLILFLLFTPINNPIQHINFIDVGQGNATLIHGEFGKFNILVDTGSKYNYSKLKNALYEEGIYTLDYLIISHEDEDHSGNIDNLKNDFKVKEIITIGKNIKIDECELKYLNLGQYDNDNDNSLVYLLTMDKRRILLPGDVSKKVENIIVNKYDIRNIDILDIGHHGSNSSSSSYFIGSLNPEYVIISTNGKYGHPHEDTINTLNSYKLDYLITKDEGSIKFYLTKYIDICISNKRIELL